MRQSKLLSLLLAVLTALAVLTGAVAVPILCRPFYYAQIGPLGLESYTGLTGDQIRQAYDEVLDYCTGLSEAFSAGVLPFSDSGASHFADVRGLFLLDLGVLAFCLVALGAVILLCRRRVRPQPLLGRGPGFWGACGLGAVFLVIGGLAALDFGRAFTVFHALFFPGKDNWLFDPETDQIITILPQVFFRNCAILILAVLILGCASLIVFDVLSARRRTKGD